MDKAFEISMNQFDFESLTVKLNELILENPQADIIVKDHRFNFDELKNLINNFPQISLIPKSSKKRGSTRTTAKKLTTQETMEVLQSSLLSIYRAKSLVEMETTLLQSLGASLHLKQIRIIDPLTLENFKKNLKSIGPQVFYEKSYVEDDTSSYSIFYFRKGNKSFRKFELKLMDELSEVVQLALSRIGKLIRFESLKFQWEATFNSLNEPICIVNKKGDVTRSNLAFQNLFQQEKMQTKLIDILGIDSRSVKKVLSQESSFQYKDRFFDISEYEISEAKIINFVETTEEKRLEAQIFDSSRLAELGIIGSSMAHELNNPIGGMLSYLQLIKMDLDKNSTILQDIEEMEKSCIKCKNIVEDLLNFARTDSEAKQEIVITEVLDVSVKLCQLQDIFLNIEMDNESTPSNSLKLSADKNQLIQAFTKLFQFFHKSFYELNKDENSIQDQRIKIKTLKDPPGLLFESLIIFDKSSDESFQLTQTFKDIGFDLEISSHPKIGIAAKLTWQRLDLKDQSQVFDREI